MRYYAYLIPKWLSCIYGQVLINLFIYSLIFNHPPTQLSNMERPDCKKITSAVRETGASRHNGAPILIPQYDSAVMVRGVSGEPYIGPPWCREPPVSRCSFSRELLIIANRGWKEKDVQVVREAGVSLGRP